MLRSTQVRIRARLYLGYQTGHGYRGTLIIRKRIPLGPYHLPVPGVLGGGAFSCWLGTPVVRKTLRYAVSQGVTEYPDPAPHRVLIHPRRPETRNLEPEFRSTKPPTINHKPRFRAAGRLVRPWTMFRGRYSFDHQSDH